uniref:Gamma tubulin complex component C-terminal domain-containing protein n=1 Tax=Chaetoceros debilis TaxID=122233 RepID=A0A7S3Q330_9STRA
MERTVAIASSQVHKHILSSLFDQHHLMEHLHGLKEIMFLGQGAFISSLMDGLHAEFESRESLEEIHMISLLNVFLASVGSTNAKFLPQFVTDRVQVRLLPIDDTVDSFWITGDGDGNNNNNNGSDDADLAKDGWDIFSLGYAADAPLTAVVHPEAMEKYHLVFNLLFRLKRIEWMMNNTWRQSTVLNHTLQILISKYGTVELGPSTSTQRENALTRTKRLLRKFSMTRQSMLHFITNLQSYFMFEVLESGWKTLVDKLSSAKSLDEVIASHNEYLDEIVAKSLLGESFLANANVNAKEGEKQKQRKKGGEIYKIERQLRRVLTATFRFCKIHERIFSKALDTIEKAGEKRRGAERKSMAGKWGFENFDPDVEGSNFFNLAGEGRLEEVEAVSEEFDICLRNLLAMLTDRINGTAGVKDVDVNVSISSPSPLRAPVPVEADRMQASNIDSLRFLTFRLDFSGFYGQ